MNGVRHWGSLIFRIGYGSFYLLVGLYGSYSLVSGEGNPFAVEPGPGAKFQAALDETGFIVPIMLVCFLAGGGALTIDRTAPLGIMLLAPFVVVIFFYHTMLGGSLIWAFFWAGGLILLAYQYRSQLGVLVGISPENGRT